MYPKGILATSLEIRNAIIILLSFSLILRTSTDTLEIFDEHPVHGVPESLLFAEMVGNQCTMVDLF